MLKKNLVKRRRHFYPVMTPQRNILTLTSIFQISTSVLLVWINVAKHLQLNVTTQLAATHALVRQVTLVMATLAPVT